MIKVKKLLQYAVLLMIFVALVFLSALVTMKAATWGRTVVVPDVASRDLSEAITLLKKSSLGIKVDREEYHPFVPAGSVISQSPLPGSTVKRDRNVSVVVSLGSQEVTVPDFFGESYRRALVAVKQAGLTLGEVARVYSEHPRDNIISQDPPALSALQKGTKVNLLVSAGPEPLRSVMPDITGKTFKEAEEALKPLGAGVVPSGKGPVIVSQERKPGFPILAGEYVKVTLGARSAPPAATAPPAAPAVPAATAVKPAEQAPGAQEAPPVQHLPAEAGQQAPPQPE